MSFSETGLLKVIFSGRNGAGYCTTPGTKVGDLVLVVSNGPNTLETGLFYSEVDTDDTISQASSANESAKTFTAILIRHP